MFFFAWTWLGNMIFRYASHPLYKQEFVCLSGCFLVGACLSCLLVCVPNQGSDLLALLHDLGRALCLLLAHASWPAGAHVFLELRNPTMEYEKRNKHYMDISHVHSLFVPSCSCKASWSFLDSQAGPGFRVSPPSPLPYWCLYSPLSWFLDEVWYMLLTPQSSCRRGVALELTPQSLPSRCATDPRTVPAVQRGCGQLSTNKQPRPWVPSGQTANQLKVMKNNSGAFFSYKKKQ